MGAYDYLIGCPDSSEEDYDPSCECFHVEGEEIAPRDATPVGQGVTLLFGKHCPRGPHESGPRCLPPWGLSGPSSRPRSTRTASSWCTSGLPSSKSALFRVMAKQPDTGLVTSIATSTTTKGAISPHSLERLARTSLRR
jgi:hypothetical protein